MNKRIICFLIVILLCIGMMFISGCDSENSPNIHTDENNLLVDSNILIPEQVLSVNDGYDSYLYYRDKVTNVMYFSHQHAPISRYGTATMTIMMDPETNGPLMYDRWLAYLEQAQAQGE